MHDVATCNRDSPQSESQSNGTLRRPNWHEDGMGLSSITVRNTWRMFVLASIGDSCVSTSGIYIAHHGRGFGSGDTSGILVVASIRKKHWIAKQTLVLYLHQALATIFVESGCAFLMAYFQDWSHYHQSTSTTIFDLVHRWLTKQRIQDS